MRVGACGGGGGACADGVCDLNAQTVEREELLLEHLEYGARLGSGSGPSSGNAGGLGRAEILAQTQVWVWAWVRLVQLRWRRRQRRPRRAGAPRRPRALLAHLLEVQLLLGLGKLVLNLLRAPPLLRQTRLELAHLGGVELARGLGLRFGVGSGSSYGSG